MLDNSKARRSRILTQTWVCHG